MVLGHDHHSYATRLQAIRAAFDINVPLEVILYQLVKIKEGDIEVRMSKRKGAIIELDDIIDTVGKDVARFFYLHRKRTLTLILTSTSHSKRPMKIRCITFNMRMFVLKASSTKRQTLLNL